LWRQELPWLLCRVLSLWPVPTNWLADPSDGDCLGGFLKCELRRNRWPEPSRNRPRRLSCNCGNPSICFIELTTHTREFSHLSPEVSNLP
jgi:hypothetical protein